MTLEQFNKKFNAYWRRNWGAAMTLYHVKNAIAQGLGIDREQVIPYINTLIDKRNKQSEQAEIYAPKLLNKEITTEEYINKMQENQTTELEWRICEIVNWKMGFKIQ